MRYLVRKLVSFVITLFFISVITFFALQILPGDPAVLILGTEGDPAQLKNLQQQLGLDQDPITRYFNWIASLFQGDMGESIRYSLPVAGLVRDGLSVTLWLALMGVGFSLIISIPLGILCAIRKGTFWETIILSSTQIGMAIPAFWLGILLINLFALRLDWLPPTGYTSLKSLILPALALAIPRAAVLIRVVRSSMLNTFGQDYMRTAKSKGLSQQVVLYKHALKNASINIVSVAGVHLTQLLAGTIVLEQVFGLPGLGQLLLAAVLQRDLPLVQGLVVTAATMILVVNLIFDLFMASLDPRVRFD